MTNPSVTVIIPAYNQEGYVREAISSVLATEIDEVEVFVINDGSTDDTAGAVLPFLTQGYDLYDDRVSYLEKENEGKSAALNDVRSCIKSDYVTILDADDRLPPRSIESRLSEVRRHKGTVGLVIGGFSVFRGEEELGMRPAPATTDPGTLRRMFFWGLKTPFSLNNGLIRRELFLRTGAFDPRLRRCQDIDFAIRMLTLRPSIAVVGVPVYEYRKHRVEPAQRLRIRMQTAKYRAMAFWKNASPQMKVPSAVWALFLDMMKAGYELGGTYND